VRRSGARNPIVVGDRLDTDIEGANAVGCASLLVLTGVTRPIDLLNAAAQFRPTYLAPDLTGLLRRHVAPQTNEGDAQCGHWLVRTERGVLHLSSGGSAHADEDDDGLDALRALCAAAWAAAGSEGGSVGVDAADADAAAELRRLGLAG
jgi:hypothetical protein